MSHALVWLGVVGSLANARAQSAYEAAVGPLFQARCASCHGAEKQKGKLALHTWDGVAKGGDSGPLWVAGKPGESELLRRLKLPHDDEEHMPPSDEPQLAKEELELLVRWIEAGPSRERGVAELKLSPELARAVAELPEKLRVAGPTTAKEPVWEFNAAAVEKARALLAKQVLALQREFPGALTYESRTSAALHFTAAGLGKEFGDAQLARLAPIAAALVQVDLSGSAITDQSAAALAGMAQLRVLRLAATGVTDATLARLGGLAKLEVIVLPQGGVTSEGVSSLKKAAALRRVHLAGGPLADAAAKAGLPVVATGAEALDVPVAKPESAATASTPKSK